MFGRLTSTEVAHILAGTVLFAGLESAALDDLAQAGTQRTLDRHQYLWWQGDAGDRLCVVASGHVKLVLSSERGDDLILAVVGPGEAIGELALLDGGPRSASAVASERTTVIMIPRPALLDVMSRHPAVLDAVMRALGRLVRSSNELAADQVFLDVAGRLAKVLIRLAAERSPDAAGFVDLGLTQSDLAAMVGATRPAVNRALQVLVARELITLRGASVAIRDIDGLRRRADG